MKIIINQRALCGLRRHESNPLLPLILLRLHLILSANWCSFSNLAKLIEDDAPFNLSNIFYLIIYIPDFPC